MRLLQPSKSEQIWGGGGGWLYKWAPQIWCIRLVDKRVALGCATSYRSNFLHLYLVLAPPRLENPGSTKGWGLLGWMQTYYLVQNFQKTELKWKKLDGEDVHPWRPPPPLNPPIELYVPYCASRTRVQWRTRCSSGVLWGVTCPESSTRPCTYTCTSLA